jgi:flagellar biosynthesis protein FliR
MQSTLPWLSWPQQAIAIVHEVTIGLALGIVAALPVWAVQSGSAAIESSLGSAVGSGAAPPNRAMPASLLWSLTVAVVFFASHGPALIFGQIAKSYHRIPVATDTATTAFTVLASTTMHALTSIFVLALPMAIPMLLTILVVNVALNLSARIAHASGPLAVTAAAVPIIILVATAAVFGLMSDYAMRIMIAALS